MFLNLMHLFLLLHMHASHSLRYNEDLRNNIQEILIQISEFTWKNLAFLAETCEKVWKIFMDF